MEVEKLEKTKNIREDFLMSRVDCFNHLQMPGVVWVMARVQPRRLLLEVILP